MAIAGCRRGSRNGKAVTDYVVFTFLPNHVALKLNSNGWMANFDKKLLRGIFMNQGIEKGGNPQVDRYLAGVKKWREELVALREIMLDCQLTEALKWGKPCYVFGENNIVILQGFKAFCAVLFTKGALLRDREGVLKKPGPNTQSARRIPFTNVDEINAMAATLKTYLREAVEVEKQGLKVAFKKPSEFEIPEELQNKLDAMPPLKTAFEALTPGRQRGYLLHFSSAKQSKTRVSRIEKCIPAILEGKGFHDR